MAVAKQTSKRAPSKPVSKTTAKKAVPARASPDDRLVALVVETLFADAGHLCGAALGSSREQVKAAVGVKGLDESDPDLFRWYRSTAGGDEALAAEFAEDVLESFHWSLGSAKRADAIEPLFRAIVSRLETTHGMPRRDGKQDVTFQPTPTIPRSVTVSWTKGLTRYGEKAPPRVSVATSAAPQSAKP